MKFEFRLDAVEDIAPWTNSKGTKKLGWYALTLGWFWIDAAEPKLFRYSDEIIGHSCEKYPLIKQEPPYVSYQVARLWEDLIVMLPHVLTPLPNDLATKIANAERWRTGTERAYRYSAESNELLVQFENALYWWRKRTLDTAYLRYGPDIWLWTVDDMVHLRWDNRGISENNVPIWRAESGELSMPIGAFIEELTLFDALFMSTMAERVETICHNGCSYDVLIDLEHLKLEQRERSTWLAGALSRPRECESWDIILSDLSELERLLN